MRCSTRACSFFASSYSEFSAMSPNSRATRIRSATSRRFSVERYSISCFSFVALFGEDDFLGRRHAPPRKETRRRIGAVAGKRYSRTASCARVLRGYAFRERRPIAIFLVDRAVEVPSRVVLAPMAGVSVQAFRRQGRRFGAGLVCSEMVSCAGFHHGNERTLGYLRIAADEHPLAVQIFGSEPALMARRRGWSRTPARTSSTSTSGAQCAR